LRDVCRLLQLLNLLEQPLRELLCLRVLRAQVEQVIGQFLGDLRLILVVGQHQQDVVEQRRVVAARRPPELGELGLHHLLQLQRYRRLAREIDGHSGRDGGAGAWIRGERWETKGAGVDATSQTEAYRGISVRRS
jgi:hypothetical protein